MSDSRLRRIVRITAGFPGDLGSMVGTGFLLTSSKVLTAQHVVEKVTKTGGRVRANRIQIDGSRPDKGLINDIPAEISWLGEKELPFSNSEALDAALLTIKPFDSSMGFYHQLIKAPLGEVDFSAAGFSCGSKLYEATGEADWKFGRVQPTASGRLNLVLDLSETEGLEKRFWSGVSGGPVFLRSESTVFPKYLYGINRSGLLDEDVAEGKSRAEGRLLAVSILALLQNEGFLREIGLDQARSGYEVLRERCSDELRANDWLRQELCLLHPEWAGRAAGSDLLLDNLCGTDLDKVLTSLSKIAGAGREACGSASFGRTVGLLAALAVAGQANVSDEQVREVALRVAVATKNPHFAELLIAGRDGRSAQFEEGGFKAETRSIRRVLEVPVSKLEKGLRSETPVVDQMRLVDDFVVGDLGGHYFDEDDLEELLSLGDHEKTKAAADILNVILGGYRKTHGGLPYLLLTARRQRSFGDRLDSFLDDLKDYLVNLQVVELDPAANDYTLRKEQLTKLWEALGFRLLKGADR